jgi:hypothetical protein
LLVTAAAPSFAGAIFAPAAALAFRSLVLFVPSPLLVFVPVSAFSTSGAGPLLTLLAARDIKKLNLQEHYPIS